LLDIIASSHTVSLNPEYQVTNPKPPQHNRPNLADNKMIADHHKKPATAPLGKNGPQVTRLGYGAMGLVGVHPML
jgi:hypothetical protein